MPSKSELDLLAEQIKKEITRKGCHFPEPRDLKIFWDHGVASEDQKRLAIENFAKRYGFVVHLTPKLKVAVFQNLDQGALKKAR